MCAPEWRSGSGRGDGSGAKADVRRTSRVYAMWQRTIGAHMSTLGWVIQDLGGGGSGIITLESDNRAS